MRKKRNTNSKDCVDVRRLLDSVQIDPKSLISFLEDVCVVTEHRISSLKEIYRDHPNFAHDFIPEELKLRHAQCLLYVLKIAENEGYKLKYINPSLN